MALKSTLGSVFDLVAADLEEVERGLRARLDEIIDSHTLKNRYSQRSDRAVGHLLRVPGKRLRPAMMILSARASGGDSGEATANGGTFRLTRQLVDLSVGVELIHSASLVHDDVIDEARFRRARLSVNARFGNKLAVLAGDVLFTEFYTIVSSLEDVPPELRLQLLEMFTRVTRRMCFGEMYEERMRHERDKVAFEEYIDLIENKTACLMSACCEAGALIVRADEASIAALAQFGRELGTAYQLYDDLADDDSVFADHEMIQREAARHADAATAVLGYLPESDARNRLAGLVDLLRSRARAPKAPAEA